MRLRLDSDRMAAWRLLLESHAAVTAVLEEELVAARDLPLAWYDVLAQLNAAPGRRLRMQELAERVLISKSGTTRLVDRLEQADLVCRESCPSDRRGTFAQLTAEGRSRLMRAAPVHVRGVAEHFAEHLTDDEVATMRTALTKVLEANRPSNCTGAAK